MIKEKLGNNPWDNTTECYPKSYRSITNCDEPIVKTKLTSTQSWFIALLVLVFWLGKVYEISHPFNYYWYVTVRGGMNPKKRPKNP